MEKLKKKWGINSNFQLLIIFIVFSINGSLAVFLAKPITNFLHISKETTAPLIYWPIRIVVVFVVYQITLVLVGAIFGQKDFFWNIEKKMIKRLGLGFLLKD